MEATMIVLLRRSPGAVPGLYDLELPDGSVRRDLTHGQVLTLARREGWTLIPAR
jgi:hypothetical protein